MSSRQRAEATSKTPPPGELAVMWRGKRFKLPRADAFPPRSPRSRRRRQTPPRSADHPRRRPVRHLALTCHHGRRRRGLLHQGHGGVGAGKPLTVAQLLGDDTTADALETDLLERGVDLLDLYRGRLTYRRLCTLVSHLPADAAVWRAHHPGGGHTRAELLLAAVERRVTILWATVSAALGHQVTDEHLAGPLDRETEPPEPQPHSPTLREIARMMQD